MTHEKYLFLLHKILKSHYYRYSQVSKYIILNITNFSQVEIFLLADSPHPPPYHPPEHGSSIDTYYTLVLEHPWQSSVSASSQCQQVLSKQNQQYEKAANSPCCSCWERSKNPAMTILLSRN